MWSRLARWGIRARDELLFVRACHHAGLIGLEPPHRLLRIVRAFYRYGLLGGAVPIAAIKHGDRAAVIDADGQLTYGELDASSNAIANAWIARGLKAGDGVAVLARNHRSFLQATVAAAKCGARVILMNTGFAGPQIREVAEREGAKILVIDEEYEAALADFTPPLGRWRAWLETRPADADTLAHLIATTPASPAPSKPASWASLVILTSGTTGTPKGAGRHIPASLAPVGSPLTRVPFKARDVTHMAAPMFHALGFSESLLAIGLGSTLVLHRHFDPRKVLESVAENHVNALIVVPVMLQRIMDLGAEAIAAYDHSSLRIIYMSGSQLPTAVCMSATEAFGPVIYNLYGSTEIAYAAIATPEDLAIEPACVGKVLTGAVIRILDEQGHEVQQGQTGRIFVGSVIAFEGYTSGDDKERLNGLVSSGDVGHLDLNGRLFIDGRDDDMIISGGENVFPLEVEELLASHPDVVEVAALGVSDEHFGQRLNAFVVVRAGSELDEDQVKDFVRANLARYKVPREVRFLDELPRNATGKILRRRLAEL